MILWSSSEEINFSFLNTLQTVRIWGCSEDGNYTSRHTLKDHSAEVRM